MNTKVTEIRHANGMSQKKKETDMKDKMIYSSRAEAQAELDRVRGTVIGSYSSYNPRLGQHCLAVQKLMARLRCNDAVDAWWLEYGWVDGSHPSMYDSWDTEEEAKENAKTYAEARDTKAEWINPSPFTQRGLVPRSAKLS